ncbi:hypothetical protein BDQ17DRAFT_1411470, partial [Cyathus striatus]
MRHFRSCVHLSPNVPLLVLNFSRIELLDVIIEVVLWKYIGIYFTAFVAQVFYASRIWILTAHLSWKFRILAYPVIVLALTQVGSGLALIFYRRQEKTYTNLNQMSNITFIVIILQGVAAAACDIVITASFSYICHSNRSGINSPVNSLLNKFIVYAINRAAATSVCAFLSVFMFHYLSGSFYYLIPFHVNTHLYVISVTSLLTQRGSLRD